MRRTGSSRICVDQHLEWSPAINNPLELTRAMWVLGIPPTCLRRSEIRHSAIRAPDQHGTGTSAIVAQAHGQDWRSETGGNRRLKIGLP